MTTATNQPVDAATSDGILPPPHDTHLATHNRPRSTLMKSAWLAPTLIFIIASALRLTLFLTGPAHDLQRAYYDDSYRYIELAENMLAFGSFAKAEEDSGAVHIPLSQLRLERGEMEPRFKNGLRPEVFRTPGYPAFIASIFGFNGSIRAVLIAQCVVSAAGVVLVYLLGIRLGISRLGAAAAAMIVAVNPADTVSANSLLSETLFTTIVLLGLWLVLQGRNRNTYVLCTGAAIIGLSVLIRPVSILLGPAIGIWMVATDRRAKSVLAALVITACSLLPAAAWAARNNSVGLGFRVSSVPYINNYFYTTAYMDIVSDGKDKRADWPNSVAHLFDELRANIGPEEDVFAAMNRLTTTKVWSNPSLYAQVITQSAIKFMTDHSASDLYKTLDKPYQPTGLRDRLLRGDWSLGPNTNSTALLVAGAWITLNIALAGLMVAGLIRLAVLRQWAPLLLLGGVILYFMLATQATGLERFRLPVLGLQALCVAAIFEPRQRKSIVL